MSEHIKLGLFGHNLSKSRAKSLHELLGKLNGLNVTYENLDLKDNSNVDFAAELKKCKEQGFKAVNITYPFKQVAYKLAKIDQALPKSLNAINTLLFENENYFGTNTDFTGYYKATLDHFGKDFKPGKVLMLGAGGVGTSIASALYKLNVEELVIFDIDETKVAAILEPLKATGCNVRHADKNLISEMKKANGLINATPVGIHFNPGNPFPKEGFANQQWAFDAIYTPENTEFMQCCRANKMDTLSGFKLFMYQGVDAFKLFTGIQLDVNETERNYLKHFPDTLVSK
jgi:shikimate dehydrogenase